MKQCKRNLERSEYGEKREPFKKLFCMNNRGNYTLFFGSLAQCSNHSITNGEQTFTKVKDLPNRGKSLSCGGKFAPRTTTTRRPANVDANGTTNLVTTGGGSKATSAIFIHSQVQLISFYLFIFIYIN